ncbi:dTMP kinase [Candidatus Parcubacteria bacterium]|nr:dTMP kinase [Candidatus Parcubacteria bacterium]
MNKGKFIVFDGIDGSGKTTQFEILKKKLVSEGFKVEIADFPQYGTKSAGLVENYLNGNYGEANDVGPYRASIFYACDRYDASFKIKKWISEGKIIISNRYVTANMAHQGGKISNDIEREKYFEWLDNLEYKLFQIPRPDINIILHLDAIIAQKLVDKKGHRDYIGGSKRDIHESDLEHLKNAEKIYLKIASSFPNFKLIRCTENNNIMTKEKIARMIWENLQSMLNTKNS